MRYRSTVWILLPVVKYYSRAVLSLAVRPFGTQTSAVAVPAVVRKADARARRGAAWLRSLGPRGAALSFSGRDASATPPHNDPHDPLGPARATGWPRLVA
jgi:hypothetical protein